MNGPANLNNHVQDKSPRGPLTRGLWGFVYGKNQTMERQTLTRMGESTPLNNRSIGGWDPETKGRQCVHGAKALQHTQGRDMTTLEFTFTTSFASPLESECPRSDGCCKQQFHEKPVS